MGWRSKSVAPGSKPRGKGWRDSGLTDVEKQRRFYRALWGSTCAVVAGLVLLFIYYLFLRPLATPLIIASVGHYSPILPPNAWAQEDLESMLARWPDSHYSWSGPRVHVTGRLWDWSKSSDALADIVTQVREAGRGGPGRNVSILYLSAHGVLNDEGDPCLITQSSPTQESLLVPWDDTSPQLLSLTQLLRRLATDEGIDRSLRKLVVVLDASRIRDLPQLGITSNEFNSRLADVVDAANAPGGLRTIYLLTSAAAHETGQTSPSAGRSVFSAYFEEGLAGRAAPGRQQVTLRQLYEYVRSGVSSWTWQAYGEPQTPQLYPEVTAQSDFPLAYVAAGPPAPASARPSIALRDDLKLDWSQHARWLHGFELRPVPDEHALPWEALQQQLLRFEQDLLAGKAYVADADRLSAAITNSFNRLQEPSRIGFRAYSLPLQAAAAAAPQNLQPLQKAWQAIDSAPADRLREVATEQLRIFKGMSGSLELVEFRWLQMLADPDYGRLGHADSDTFVGQALHLRGMGETAAALGSRTLDASGFDPRCLYAVRPAVDSGDQLRRQVDDRVFISATSALPQQELNLAEKQYQEALARTKRVAAAYEDRDRAWRVLPSLARWVTLRRYATVEQRDRAVENCAELIRLNASKLAAALEELSGTDARDGGSPTDASTVASRLDAAGQAALQSRLDELRRAFDTVAASPDTTEVDIRHWRECLEVSLLSGDQRVAILQRILDREAGTPWVEPPSGAEPSGRRDSELATGPVLHSNPFELLLGLSESCSDTPGDLSPQGVVKPDALPPRELARKLAQQARCLRLRIAEIDSELGRHHDAKVESDVERHRQLSAADQSARSAMSLYSWLEPTEDCVRRWQDATQQLKRYDLHQFLVWQARRTLDDFWGPGGQSSPTTGDPKPVPSYFEQVASNYLEDAHGLWPQSKALDRGQDLLRQRRQSAADLTLKVAGPASDKPLRGTSPFESVASLQAGEAPLPVGQAAVLVRDPRFVPETAATDDARKSMPGRWPLSVSGSPNTAAKVGMSLVMPDLPSDEETATLPVDLFFRDHRRHESVKIAAAPRNVPFWRQLIFNKPPEPQEPTVVAFGPTREPGSVTLILDCSASMTSKVDDHGTDRMESAKQALREIVAQLARSGRYRVSLWLFGHRVGLDDRNAAPLDGKIARVDAWGPVPRDILFANDVQRVFPATVLNEQTKPQLLAEIAKASPWGRTPLYFSAIEALQKEIATFPADAPKRLVIITDGENLAYDRGERLKVSDGGVTRELPEPWESKYFVGVDQVAENIVRINDKARDPEGRVQVHLLRFDVPLDKAWQELPNRGISFHDYNIQGHVSEGPSAAQQLIDAIRKSLGPIEYTVAGSGDHRPWPPTSFGTELKLPRVRERYDASVPQWTKEDAPFRIEEDEAILLHYDSQLQRLVHSMYDPDKSLEYGKIVRNPRGGGDPDLDPAEYHVSYLNPKHVGAAGYLFPILVQNQDGTRFKPRPTEAWLDVQPIDAQGEPLKDPKNPQQNVPRFRLFDYGFRSRTPAPVLEFNISQWPAGVRWARMAFYFKVQDAANSQTASPPSTSTPATTSARHLLNAVRRDEPWSEDSLPDPTSALDIPLPDGGRLQFAVNVAETTNGVHVHVVQFYPRDDSEARVQIVSPRNPTDTADRITLQYYSGRLAPSGHWILYDFYFRRHSYAEVLDYELRVTPPADLQHNALHVEFSRVPLEE